MTDYDPNEDDQVKAELGECLYAGDHEDVGGVCIHCGAEFFDEHGGKCYICGDPTDHHGARHSDVTGDRRGRFGLQREDGSFPARDEEVGGD